MIETFAKYISSILISSSKVHPLNTKLPFITLLLYLAPIDTLLRTKTAYSITEALNSAGIYNRNSSKVMILLFVNTQFSKTDSMLSESVMPETAVFKATIPVIIESLI